MEGFSGEFCEKKIKQTLADLFPPNVTAMDQGMYMYFKNCWAW